MKIILLEQKIQFFFDANNQYFRIDFDRKHESAPWNASLYDMAHKKMVYQSRLDATISPDQEFARQIIKTFITGGEIIFR